MHFPCGQEAGATFQFMGKMHTYCFMHRVKQKVETFPTPPDTDCVICYEKVDQVLENFKKIRAPCCGRHFHRDCVQRFAMTSGTQHFKCPNCNNQEEITKEFKKNGVYIPYKDAEWGAVSLYARYDHSVLARHRDQQEQEVSEVLIRLASKAEELELKTEKLTAASGKIIFVLTLLTANF